MHTGWEGGRVRAEEADIFTLHARSRTKSIIAQPVFVGLTQVKAKMFLKLSRIQLHALCGARDLHAVILEYASTLAASWRPKKRIGSTNWQVRLTDTLSTKPHLFFLACVLENKHATNKTPSAKSIIQRSCAPGSMCWCQ
jgi:hypothetical protein